MEQIDGEYFKNLISQMRDTGYPQEIDRVQISIPNAEKRLRGGLQYVVNMKSGCNAEWNEHNYRPIVDWMTDNKGKGLLMFGGCGLGKSVIGMYILPLLIKDVHKKVVNIFSAQELNKKIDEILKLHIIYIDDVGTEDNLNSYGNKRMPFAELCDDAEKNGKLLILTTNLSIDELTERYGDRVVDRLIATTKAVPFTGDSLRK
jgi:DNA replication protein DnaC|nr:MAG TPA: replicative helicase [Caudoviricetes sp.]